MPAPRILLIHGYLSSPAAWAPLQRELGGETVTFAPFLPGYGGEPDPAGYTLPALAGALEELLDEAQPQYLLGHSMGAILALELARRHPGRFARVGLSGLPVFATIEEGRRFIGAKSRTRARYLRDPAGGHAFCGPLQRTRYLWATAARRLRAGYPLPVLLDLFDHSAAAHRGGLERIVFAGHVPDLAALARTPVAVLHGDADGVAPVAPVAALARAHGWAMRIAGGAAHEVIFARPRGVARWVREHLLAPAEPLRSR